MKKWCKIYQKIVPNLLEMVQNLSESGALSFIGARFVLVQHLFKKLHNFLLVTEFDKMTKTTLLLVLNFYWC